MAKKIKQKPPLVNPFTVIYDTREQIPYRFTGIEQDQTKRNIAIPTIRSHVKYGDYTILGMEKRISIERKTHSDFLGSITEGRDRLKREFAGLNQMEFAAIVIEADWHKLLFESHKISEINPKVITRTIISWSIKFPMVHWFLLTGRRHSEIFTFRLLEKFWKLDLEKKAWEEKNGRE